MVGRNFWAVPVADGWEVRQEGLPSETSRHSDPDEAWRIANDRAKACHGEAFLGDGAGGCVRQACYRTMPRKIKI